jgi:hypothetical protein
MKYVVAAAKVVTSESLLMVAPRNVNWGRNATRAAARSAVVGRPVSSRPVRYTKATAPSMRSAVISRASRRGQYRARSPPALWKNLGGKGITRLPNASCHTRPGGDSVASATGAMIA